MADNQIGYKDVNPFFQHINWLLEQDAKLTLAYNDLASNGTTQPLQMQVTRLEDRYMNLETLFHRIIGKLGDDEITDIDALCKEIETVTKGDNFATCNLTSGQITTIRTQCRKLSRKLNALLWKHRIHVDVKSNKAYKSHDDEIDDENAL